VPSADHSATVTPSLRTWLGRLAGDIDALDRAVSAAIRATPTPSLDAPLRSLSRAADSSKLWVGTALVIAVAGGPRGRRAAVAGLASVGVASATVNLALKYGAARPRPQRAAIDADRDVPMPASTSFPSGHAASAFAFAVGTGNQLPVLALPLNALAACVAYSRVHAAVHYPSDVVAGAAIGGAAGALISRLTRLRYGRDA
jgi:membrane-associated phospholipid phosphatase